MGSRNTFFIRRRSRAIRESIVAANRLTPEQAARLAKDFNINIHTVGSRYGGTVRYMRYEKAVR